MLQGTACVTIFDEQALAIICFTIVDQYYVPPKIGQYCKKYFIQACLRLVVGKPVA
jgi:hypothetical protein